MSLDDSKYKNFMKNNTKNIELLGGFAPLGYIPWLVKLLPDRVIGMDKVYEAAALFSEYSKVCASVFYRYIFFNYSLILI